MQTHAIILYIVILFVLVGGFVWYTEVYRKSPKTVEISPELQKIIEEQVKYNGGGAQEIESIKDDLDLYHAVFMWCLPDESNYLKALEQVMNHNPGQRAIYLVNTLDYEVCNGGFNQYFYNKGPVLALETIKSLRHLGEAKRADLLEKALQNYRYVEEGHTAAKSAGPAEKQFEAFSKTYHDNPLDDLDSQYYKAGDDMWGGLARYIIAHPDEFKK
ncbi:MAG: DMP19 family protein [Blastochloris sp.]|nr:DMP19 family protein [Blastochloris sp.]